MFSKDGPNLISPALTNKPKVIPKIYKLKNNRSRGNPNSKIETTEKGAGKIIAGTRPINVLNKAVNVKEALSSWSFKGAINKYVKFLLHIYYKTNI